MAQIRLVSWNPDAVREHAGVLKKAGFKVDASPLRTSGLIGQFRDHPPAVIVIDLDRLPSHGHAVAVVLRSGKSTRHIPIVFAGGQEEKIRTAREQWPGAIFTDWPGAPSALKKALEKPAISVPAKSYMQHYAGSSLIKKLGFKPNMRAALLGAPEGFEEQLGELPEGIEFEPKVGQRTQMAIWFVRSWRELADETEYLSARLPNGASIWIVYPKQTSRFKVDFTQHDVRALGLAASLVDYKICAVDSIGPV
jgi:CheY-like chemotaxis protein